MSQDPRQEHLNRLRQWRGLPERDLTLGFLRQQFRTQVERPYQQLAGIIAAWEKLVPAELQSHARLEGLQRGVLKVAVDSSARLYELDRLLRGGLRQQLALAAKGSGLRRVALRVTQLD